MFRNKKSLFSFMLVLVLVLGMGVSAFAATIIDDTPPTDFGLTVAGADVSYKAVTVEGGANYPDVTRYTAYIEFLSSSGVDLSDVQILASYDSLYSLTVDGVPYVPNMSLDFSGGYVDFTLKDSNNIEYKNYMVNAGIKGTNTEIIVSIDLKNANDWLDGVYDSNATGYNVPEAADYSTAKSRVQDAVDGLEDGPLIVQVTADIGDSAMDVFKEAISAVNLDLNVVDVNTGYVSEIGRETEPTLPALLFQKTEPDDFPPQDWEKDRTGWIYLMNDEVASIGAGQYIITASDESLTWGYTFDWGIDLGGAEW